MKVTVCNWRIVRELGFGYDPILIQGDFYGHPLYQRGTPGAFTSFDKMNGIGVSISGRTYEFDRISFNPTGFAKTVEEAFDWIEKNWVKK